MMSAILLFQILKYYIINPSIVIENLDYKVKHANNNQSNIELIKNRYANTYILIKILQHCLLLNLTVQCMYGVHT